MLKSIVSAVAVATIGVESFSGHNIDVPSEDIQARGFFQDFGNAWNGFTGWVDDRVEDVQDVHNAVGDYLEETGDEARDIWNDVLDNLKARTPAPTSSPTPTPTPQNTGGCVGWACSNPWNPINHPPTPYSTANPRPIYKPYGNPQPGVGRPPYANPRAGVGRPYADPWARVGMTSEDIQARGVFKDFGNAWNGFTDWVDDRVEDVQDVHNAVGGYLEETGDEARDGLGNAWNGFTGWVDDRVEDVQDMHNAVGGYLEETGDEARDIWNGALDNMKARTPAPTPSQSNRAFAPYPNANPWAGVGR